MSQQPLNLRRVFELIRRYKAVVGAAAGIGLIVGAAIGSIDPPSVTSSALVILPNTRVSTQTLTLIATSDPVLTAARPAINPVPVGIATLHDQVTTASPSPNIVSINAQNANAVTQKPDSCPTRRPVRRRVPRWIGRAIEVMTTESRRDPSAATQNIAITHRPLR